MRKLAVGFVVLLIAGAFVAGYWPQRERLGQLEAELATAQRLQSEAQSRLAAAETQVRLGRLLGQFLAVRDAVSAGNYGEAQSLSSAFFDGVRDEAARASDTTVKSALDAVLARRDGVTASLARSETSVREVLVAIERELRQLLAYPLPSLPPTPQTAGAKP